jgi:acetoin utilization deacetylase AcuC-like enzyme
MRVSYAPGYFAPIGENHIFPMRKFEGLHAYLTQQKIVAPSDVIQPRMADVSTLLRVHTVRYLDAILNGNLQKREARKLGLPWTPQLAIRSQLAAQGTINAALMALQDGVSGNLAGGTHHSMPDGGEGFCVFNDVAIAIKALKSAMWIKKALVIDCDVHQGNGTAFIFSNDPDVFTFSLHGEKNYPFIKPPSTLDIGLPDKTGDEFYLKTLGDALDAIFDRFTPDIVFYLGGIDPLETDHFGRLSLTLSGLRKREELVIKTVRDKSFPLVLLLSGGYAPTVAETVIAHAQMFAAARKIYG